MARVVTNVIFLNVIAARAAQFEKLSSSSDILLSFRNHTNDASNSVSKVPYSSPAQYAAMADIYGEFKIGHFDDGKEKVFSYNRHDADLKSDPNFGLSDVYFPNHDMQGYTLLEAKMFNMLKKHLANKFSSNYFEMRNFRKFPV